MTWRYLKGTMKNRACLAGLKTVDMHLPMDFIFTSDLQIEKASSRDNRYYN